MPLPGTTQLAEKRLNLIVRNPVAIVANTDRGHCDVVSLNLDINPCGVSV